MAFHRATGLAERLVKTSKEQILLILRKAKTNFANSVTENHKTSKRTVTHQSLNLSPFGAHFVDMKHDLVQSNQPIFFEQSKLEQNLVMYRSRKKVL